MNTTPFSDDLPARDSALDTLFAAARTERPDTSLAEYGFETRLLARLSVEKSGQDAWAEFAGWCWRLIPALAVVTVAAGLWTMWPGGSASGDEPFFAATGQPLSVDDDDRLTQWLTAEWLTPI